MKKLLFIFLSMLLCGLVLPVEAGWLDWVSGGTGSETNPVEIPADQISKITGKAGTRDDGKLVATLYNGTDWTLTDVDIVIKLKKTNEERRFRLELWDQKVEWGKDTKGPNLIKTKISLKPYTTDGLEGQIGDFLQGIESKNDWTWGVDSARGYKNPS